MIFRVLLCLVSVAVLLGCAATSVEETNARDCQAIFEAAYKDYAASEEDYLILLSNLERYPKEEYLLQQKRLLRQEIEHKREVMLQSRSEFDAAVQAWDKYTVELQTKPVDTLTGPTSPGHLWEPRP
jgi:hypothetical protein